jgi:hypothetical protein
MANRSLVLNGSSQFVSAASNAGLQTGGVDFFVAGWVRRSGDGTLTIAAKQPDTSNREWILGYDTTGTFATNRLFFRVAGTGAAFQVTGNTFGALSTNTWAFVLAWRDLASGKIHLRINDTTADENSPPSGITSTTAPFILGASQATTGPTYNRYFNGRLDQVCFGKPSGAIASQISNIHATLYNDGFGLAYSKLTGSQKTDWGLVSFWELDEASGNRVDAHGSNDLSPTGTPGNGDPVPHKAGVKSVFGPWKFSVGSPGAAADPVLSADAGAFTLTGSAADLRVTRRVVADTGSFTVAGSDATLIYSGTDKVLSADAGSFALTGSDATLRVTRRLAADTGVYDFDGAAASLRRGRSLSADAGAFVLTGSDAAFARTRRLSADAGAFVLVGSAADLIYSAAPPVEPRTGFGSVVRSRTGADPRSSTVRPRTRP